MLNANSSNIAGFRFSKRGQLKRIRGSRQDMNPQHAPLARQIGFDRTGRLLVVSSLTDARFDVFRVNKRGVAGPPTAQPSASPEPFAFAFDPRNNLISVEVVNDMDFTQFSNPSSYRFSRSGKLTNINSVPTQGYAGCWTVVTKNGKFAFTSTPVVRPRIGAAVTTFGVSSTGNLTFSRRPTQVGVLRAHRRGAQPRQQVPVRRDTADHPRSAGPSRGGSPANSKIVTFKVGGNGGLTKVQETAATEEAGMSGLAAH